MLSATDNVNSRIKYYFGHPSLKKKKKKSSFVKSFFFLNNNNLKTKLRMKKRTFLIVSKVHFKKKKLRTKIETFSII